MTREVLYEGQTVELILDQGMGVLSFDRKDSSVNKLDKKTLADLGQVIDILENKISSFQGLLIRSLKDAFIVGADITEFPYYFKQDPSVLRTWLGGVHKLFSRFEDLPIPSVALIRGSCLGGGLEFTLTATYRLGSEDAVLGLPETKLGLYPGWGGTIRLPRLIGTDNALEWIASGETYRSPGALKVGVLDGIVAPENLEASGRKLLDEARRLAPRWRARVAQKKQPLTFLSPTESMMAFETAKAVIAAQAGPHYPAPMAGLKSVEGGAGLSRDQASPLEIEGFIQMAKTLVAENLVSIFLSDQFNKKKTKAIGKKSKTPTQAAVLGAGIMGGGIAYQSATRGIPILMKDIRPEALTLGMNEALKLCEKRVEKQKMTTLEMGQTLARIVPTLSFGDFSGVDLAVEAVVEDREIKKKVLAELEDKIGGILATNTSTIPIDELAEGLKRPENFCGMHFFNPVPRMPLVEVIRGKKTSDEALARVVQYALALGKTPIVVQDGPGFLVNRILFPYLFGLFSLLEDGVNPYQVDRVMERFGWPMGPAYLLDVIGLDTALHAARVMGKAFPDRMGVKAGSPLEKMVEGKRLGQKNGLGFYRHEMDKKGKSIKIKDPMFDGHTKALEDQEVIDRMMVPLLLESVRCLEDKIVETPMELDLALIYGIGFPPFRGGAMKYLDHLGSSVVVEKAKKQGLSLPGLLEKTSVFYLPMGGV
jgi:3-hydroxyacyl-CoA dehydrogenase/enoyl-CoA hydratase/3-hydroxybutyryl-CoA epimerase/enoyl-CoA isomerase